MPTGELSITLASAILSSVVSLSGNSAHITTEDASIVSTALVLLHSSADVLLDNATLSSSTKVHASATLSAVLGNAVTERFSASLDGISAPYEDVLSWTGHPLTGSRVRVRTGNLYGIFGEPGEFGIFAGDGWDANSGSAPTWDSKYIRLGSYANEFHNIPVKLYDNGNVTIQLEPDAPSFAMGSPIPTGYNVGVGLWQGKDTDGVYKWRIGDPADGGSSLNWTGDSLVLRNSSFEVGGELAHLAFGNPPPVSADEGTGIWIDRTGFYGLNNDVRQIFIDTVNGAFYAGDAMLDEFGLTIGSQLIVNRSLEEGVQVQVDFWYPTGEDFSIIWDGTDVSMTQPVDIWGELSVVDRLFIGAGNGIVEAGSDLNLKSHANNQVLINSFPACFVVYSDTEPAAPKTGMIWVDTEA